MFCWQSVFFTHYLFEVVKVGYDVIVLILKVYNESLYQVINKKVILAFN